VELRGPTWWLKRQGARIRLGTRTELRSHAAARAAADQYLAMLAPERVVAGRTLLAVSYFEQFLRVHVPLMRPTSQLKYRTVIRQHLTPAAAGRRLVELDTAWLRELVTASSTTLARATVASIRGLALQVLRQARRDGYAARIIDPRDVRLPKTSIEQERRNVRPDELGRILDASEFPRRALWAVMGYAGLRIGEALGLIWAQVELHGQPQIRVRQAAIRGRLAPLKTATSRADVPLLPELEQILASYRAAWQVNDAGLLFATRRGTPLAADYVRRYWLAPLLTELGLPKAGCHAFRHGLPARLAARGMSPDMIRRMLRHGSLAMTEGYLHSSTADLYRAARQPAQNAVGILPARPRMSADSQITGVP
jgi:integrase